MEGLRGVADTYTSPSGAYVVPVISKLLTEILLPSTLSKTIICDGVKRDEHTRQMIKSSKVRTQGEIKLELMKKCFDPSQGILLRVYNLNKMPYQIIYKLISIIQSCGDLK